MGRRPQPEPLPEPGDPEGVRCTCGAPGCERFRSVHLRDGIRICPTCDRRNDETG